MNDRQISVAASTGPVLHECPNCSKVFAKKRVLGVSVILKANTLNALMNVEKITYQAS